MSPRAKAPTKKCFVEDCDSEIPTNYLMCAFHWARVPRRIQTAVYRTCREWLDGGDFAPYDAARREAAKAVSN